MEVVANNYLPGDQRLVDKIVYELKAQGIFDQFRKECFADVDTKPAYQNLRQRVENNVTGFLKEQSWRPDMNKNQVREMLRKRITESGYLETGVERIVDQVVNPKINSVFLPKVEEVVYKYLGIEKPNHDNKINNNNHNDGVKNDNKSTIKTSDLLPHDLEAVSPESEPIDKKDDKICSNDNTQDLDDSKMDEDESPPFEPLEEQSVYNPQEENSIDSHMSGFSGLISHESNVSSDNKHVVIDLNQQDSQMSRNSSESHLSIVTSDDNSKMDICDDSQSKSIKSTDSNHKIDEKKDDNKMKIDKTKQKIDRKDDKDRERERHNSTSSNSKDSKSRHSSSHSSRNKERIREHKEPKNSSSSSSIKNDKDRSKDKDKKSTSSSSSKHSSSTSKDKSRNRKKSSSRDRERDKSRSSSSHHDRDVKKSSDSTKKSRKDDKSSHSSSDRYKRDKEKDRRKDSKAKDDHYSSRDRKNDRRSTDRDSNGGNTSSNNNNNNQSNDTNSSTTQSNDYKNNNSSIGDSNNSNGNSEQKDEIEQNKLKLSKPKFASNIKEAMKLMKIRKQLAKLEKHNQLSFASIDLNSKTLLSSSICLEDVKPNGFLNNNHHHHHDNDHDDDINSIEKDSVVISQDNWDRMEAKLNQEILNDDNLRYFENDDNDRKNLEFKQFINDEINQFNGYKRRMQSKKRKLINNNNNQSDHYVKRLKIDNKRTHNYSHIIQQTVESFQLPLSPAESDNSIDKKETTPPLKPKRNHLNKSNNQRYSSDDLYKPRPTFISSRRRGAKTLDN